MAGQVTEGCDPRPPRRATASLPVVRCFWQYCLCCDPRPPRRATASRPNVAANTAPNQLRSSAAPKGDRQPPISPAHVSRRVVAILGRPEGRPPVLASFAASWWLRSCDPRPPRRATARPPPDRSCRQYDVAILGRPEGRPPGLSAIARYRRCWLRSSAAPKGDRQTSVAEFESDLKGLRSSAAPKGDRQP